MRGDGSAYAALGLDPDADWADIERAYKRLIKRYHPDRQGGDGVRAAEINRAYRELRASPDPRQALVVYQEEPVSRAGRGWVRAAMALIIALAALLVATGPVTAFMRQFVPPRRAEAGRAGGVATASDAMDQPIHSAAVTQGIEDALRIVRRRDEAALLDASRECHRVLRQQPSVLQLDRCAAFDDAVVQLQNRDPMWDRGPFSELAVTARQWSAASALSNDYLAVDGRLDRIRLQVELALAEPPKAAGA
jgi:curved DNA-binding protein CbpA